MHSTLHVITCPACIRAAWANLHTEEQVGLAFIACLSVGAAAVVVLACWGVL